LKDIKQILLGSKNTIDKSNEDIFINLTLERSFNELKKERFDNNFNLADQFRNERNTSRDFRIYGQISSSVADCDNLSLIAYGDTGLTIQVASVNSSPTGLFGKNVFGKKNGKYLISLEDYPGNFVYIVAQNGGSNLFNSQVFAQQLVFLDGEGNFIEYGNDTIEITPNNSIVTIQNDFTFFYQKHWINLDINIDSESSIGTFDFNPPGSIGLSNSSFFDVGPVTYSSDLPTGDLIIDETFFN